MKDQIFTVYDTKAKAYLPPFFLPQQGMATRVFADLCNQEGHQFNKHPEDYSLYTIGTFDNIKAKIIEIDPLLLYTGLQLKNHTEANHEINSEPSIQPSS